MEHFYYNIGENWFTYQHFYTAVVNEFNDGAHFVEVGSWKGRSAAYMGVEIHNSNKKIKFDCVDTWRGSANEPNHQNDPLVVADKLFEEFLKNTKPVEHVITPIRKNSVNASKLYKDNTLDFVFIDACHLYECVKEDILSWLPKVKIGGIIAGHDIASPDVKKAVKEMIPEAQAFIPNDVWFFKKTQ
jgi:hypothetical protein